MTLLMTFQAFQNARELYLDLSKNHEMHKYEDSEKLLHSGLSENRVPKVTQIMRLSSDCPYPFHFRTNPFTGGRQHFDATIYLMADGPTV